MPLILSKEQVSRRQLGGWLQNYLTMVFPPHSWVYWAKSLPFGCSWAHCIGEHISLLVNRAVLVLLLMVWHSSLSCAWRHIILAESKFLFCLFWKKQLALLVSRYINWTVKGKDHKRLHIIVKCFNFLNFELSCCICQTWSGVSSAVRRRLSSCRYKRLF